MADELHVIFGTGPVGCWTARALVADGHAVRAVNRSGTRPGLLPPEVEMVRADASDAAQATGAAAGASVVYQALHPPYGDWHELFPALQANTLAAAEGAGAKFVSIENLYMYDSSVPMHEESRIAPVSKKGALRQQMAEAVAAAHARGSVRTTALRSADFYGPGVLVAALGERVFGNLVAGKKAQVIGSTTLPHSFAYIEDIGRAAAVLGTNDAALGQVWVAPHGPPQTQAAMIEAAGAVLGVAPGVSALSPLMMRLVGLFVPEMRPLVEMMYQYTQPFVVESTRMERTFGLVATPPAVGMERTVAWYRRRAASG